jgi:outer membrane protein OmpA-like peptidoglycan-associated protein
MKFSKFLFLLVFTIISGCNVNKELQRQADEQKEIQHELEDNIIALKKLLAKSDTKSETAITINKVIDNISSKLDSANKEIEKQTGKKTKTRLNNLRLKKEIISEAIQELKVVQIAVDKVVSEKLESDLSFGIGKSELREDGKKQIDDMVQNIRLQIQFWDDFPAGEQPKVYANKKKTVALNITGYADLQGSVNVEHRMKNNLELSNNRAKSVRDYFENKLNEIAKNENIEIKIKSVGRGEELPVGVKDTTKIDNPERRICVITIGVIPTFQ